MELDDFNDDVEKARQTYQTVPAIGKQALVDALKKRGVYYLQQGHLELAEADFKDVEKIMGEHSEGNETDDLNDFFSELESLDKVEEGIENEEFDNGMLEDLLLSEYEEEDESEPEVTVSSSGKSTRSIGFLIFIMIISIVGNVILGFLLNEANSSMRSLRYLYNDKRSEVDSLYEEIELKDEEIADLGIQLDALLIQLDSQEMANSTIQSLASTLLNSLDPTARPGNGSLAHNGDDNLLSTHYLVGDITNAVVMATFITPYDASYHDWDIGLMFRHVGGNDQYRLAIESDGWMEISSRDGDKSETIAYATVAGQLNYDEGDRNEVVLYFQDDQCVVLINGEVVLSTNDLDIIRSGSILIATGLYNDREITGEETIFEDVKVWSLD